MGARLSRELGLYNEEEIILPIIPENNTPTQSKYRILRTDPRSATLGIVRTPIQVECTPPSNKECQRGTKLLLDSNVKETEVNEVPVKRYLETDIDAVKAVVRHPRVISLSTDPRSPNTFETNRSPIQVECSPGTFSMCSRIDSASLDVSDCVSDDPSVIVSELGESPLVNVPKQPEDFKDWFEGLESKMSQLTTTVVSSPKKTPSKFADRNIMKKQLFLKSDNKTPNNIRPRTPLGNVQNTQQELVSLKHSVLTKQWRGIEEERSRRGVKLDDENTPPPLPPLTNISSAPGKLTCKRRITDWDKESTIFI